MNLLCSHAGAVNGMQDVETYGESHCVDASGVAGYSVPLEYETFKLTCQSDAISKEMQRVKRCGCATCPAISQTINTLGVVRIFPSYPAETVSFIYNRITYTAYGG